MPVCIVDILKYVEQCYILVGCPWQILVNFEIFNCREIFRHALLGSNLLLIHNRQFEPINV